MRLVVGLGNPGPGYAGHRHNLGAMAADAIHRRHGFGPWRARFQSAVSEGLVEGGKLLLLKPQTYMNLSGEAVAAASRFYKIEPKDVIVIYDEIDLKPGQIRVKCGGGAGGHNGIRSIDSHIGPDYWRVRLGIGHPGAPELVHHYVLQNFPKADQGWVKKLIEAVAEALPLIAAGDPGRFQNKVVVLTQPPRPKPPRPEPPASDATPQRKDEKNGI